MENIWTAILSSISTTGIIAILAYACRSWIAAKFRWSIKHEYDKKMLEVESQKEIRLKGEIVAELLAEWIRKDGQVDYHQLNKLSFQAFLWLPKGLADDLSDALSHTEGAKDIRSILVDIRYYLHGTDDGFDSNQVIVFQKPDFTGINLSPVTSDAQAKPKP